MWQVVSEGWTQYYVEDKQFNKCGSLLRKGGQNIKGRKRRIENLINFGSMLWKDRWNYREVEEKQCDKCGRLLWKKGKNIRGRGETT